MAITMDLNTNQCDRKLAVVMSLYKSDILEHVKLATESILNQSYTDFDFFIQYDGNVQTDVDDYLSNNIDERIHIQKRHENKGLAYSLNELLTIVLSKDYELIARMDADDISMPERFERQVAYMENHLDTDCLGTWAIEIKSDGSEYYKKQMPETHRGCKRQFMVRDCMIHPTVMFRRSFFKKAGLYSLDTYFGEDTMMWAQGFASGCRFANLPEYLFRFRMNDDFFSRRRGWKHAIGILSLRWKVNKMLHYPLSAYLSAIAYAGAKMMPTSILNMIYKTMR